MNRIINRRAGVASVDVSTRKYPKAVTIIDIADLPLMLDGRGRWHAMSVKNDGRLYVARVTRVAHGREFQYLHRILLGLRDRKIQGDHRDGNGLNNRRRNLRAATHAQNCQNSKRRKNGTSGYLGVSWEKARKCWTASIGRPGGGRVYLGRFRSERAAARAYDVAASDRYGQFARLNFGINGT